MQLVQSSPPSRSRCLLNEQLSWSNFNYAKCFRCRLSQPTHHLDGWWLSSLFACLNIHKQTKLTWGFSFPLPSLSEHEKKIFSQRYEDQNNQCKKLFQAELNALYWVWSAFEFLQITMLTLQIKIMQCKGKFETTTQCNSLKIPLFARRRKFLWYVIRDCMNNSWTEFHFILVSSSFARRISWWSRFLNDADECRKKC